MIDVKHLCPGCMGRWEDTSNPCPRCGFSWEKMRKGGRELEPFTILAGRYLLGVQIGAGGFGITYIAMDLDKEQPVAVKEFFPAALAVREGLRVAARPGEEGRYFREALRGFRREADLLSRFAGLKGIVSFRELTEENGTLYLVMDFVAGMTVKVERKNFYGGADPVSDAAGAGSSGRDARQGRAAPGYQSREFDLPTGWPAGAH